MNGGFNNSILCSKKRVYIRKKIIYKLSINDILILIYLLFSKTYNIKVNILILFYSYHNKIY